MTDRSLETVTILGATGSIGRQTLDVLARNPERYRVLGLTAGHRVAPDPESASQPGAP